MISNGLWNIVLYEFLGDKTHKDRTLVFTRARRTNDLMNDPLKVMEVKGLSALGLTYIGKFQASYGRLRIYRTAIEIKNNTNEVPLKPFANS